MKRLTILLALLCSQPLCGQEAALERAILDGVSADSIGEYIRRMTDRPTFPGSPFSSEVAQQTYELFRAWGWDARIDTLEIPFPRPSDRNVTLAAPEPFTAALHEPEIPGDPYTAQQNAHLETYFIYGPDGDVSAPVVYANYGLREDYDYLRDVGVSVEGRLVLVRSGRMWRGGKVQLASERGAIGVLVFSDPREQGFFDRVPYPAGPGRTQDGVERGSILNGRYPGDPLTPFEPAWREANRLPLDAPETSLAAIPALPLSAADALPILADLQGEVVPIDWRGALPTTYRTGPSGSDVRLTVTYEWDTIEIFNVVASLRGTVWPDEWVVRGNHHDGWVFGAQDPHSGHSAMLEEARVLGQLVRGGWQPRRTILYASWDAEEQGVIGSTEWVEANLEHLSDHAVAYLNTDVLGPGTLIASGTSALGAFATELAGEVMDPASGTPLVDRARVASQVDPHNVDLEPSGRFFDPEREELVMASPGYGSDHHAFVSHAGIATLNFGFTGGFSLGAYHTSYDDYTWYSRFGDPGFEYGAAAARLNALAVVRLADASLLPMEFGALASGLAREVDRLKQLYERQRARAERRALALALDAYRIVADPDRPRVPPDRAPIPQVDFTPLDNALASVRNAAAHFDSLRLELPPLTDPEDVASLNRALLEVERSFLRPGGLPGRPHYRNELYSPGRLWDTVPFPAIGDAMLDGVWTQAQAQVGEAATTLTSIGEALVQANRLIQALDRG